MNETMIIWFTIVSLLLLVFVLRAIGKFRQMNPQIRKSYRIIEWGSVKDEFYCPGDEWLNYDE